MNPGRSSAGNATARLASTRYAGPPLRFGPAGDPSQTAAYWLAMAASKLPATAGRRCHSRHSPANGNPAIQVGYEGGESGRRISMGDRYTMPCQSWRANLSRNSPAHGIPDSHLNGDGGRLSTCPNAGSNGSVSCRSLGWAFRMSSSSYATARRGRSLCTTPRNSSGHKTVQGLILRTSWTSILATMERTDRDPP